MNLDQAELEAKEDAEDIAASDAALAEYEAHGGEAAEAFFEGFAKLDGESVDTVK